LARRLATLQGFDFAGDYDPTGDYASPLYYVPNDTLIGAETLRRLGIRSERDLFGGVAPYSFVATKAISHPLVDPRAQSPVGWSHNFARCVGDALLPGFTAFALSDARRAGVELLKQGPVRVKSPRGVGGRGQTVACNRKELEAMLRQLDPAELAVDGVVLEMNLVHVATYSVGQVRMGNHLATYYGTQRLTTNNQGETVYGGSDLTVVRGDYDALLRWDLPPEARLAVMQACQYDAAATREFPGLLASRRNYDVAQGLDAQGQWRSGVLEQSWRIGGASGAEVAALEAFASDPTLTVVHAQTVEHFGTGHEPPLHATVHFHGRDERIGPIAKYTLVEPYVAAR
jgi:hypothetical protein